MAVCEGCSNHFEDSFKFCPHCGRPKTQEIKTPAPASGVICSACGAANSNLQNFCQMCGKPLYQGCPQCGHRNKSAIEYCGGCGIRLVEAKLTLTYETAEGWFGKFWAHPGVKTFYASGGYAEKKFFPYASKINELLNNDLFPVTFGEDYRIIAFPITDQNWCVSALVHKYGEIKNGLVVFRRNQMRVYNFLKNSRTVYLYSDLNGYEQDGSAVTLRFIDGSSVRLTFKVPAPSRAGANALTALEFFGSFISDVAMDKTPVERRLDDLRDEVHRSNPNNVSASSQAHAAYWENVDASSGYIPLFCSFVEAIIKHKKKINND